jgi:hypothetical protein
VLDLRPPGGDRLGAGVEADALVVVDVRLAEQRVLPAPKEWYALGTGIGTLMPIILTVTSRGKRRAVSPLAVKTAAGPTKKPSSCPSTRRSRPSATTLAPCACPEEM